MPGSWEHTDFLAGDLGDRKAPRLERPGPAPQCLCEALCWAGGSAAGPREDPASGACRAAAWGLGFPVCKLRLMAPT